MKSLTKESIFLKKSNKISPISHFQNIQNELHLHKNLCILFAIRKFVNKSHIFQSNIKYSNFRDGIEYRFYSTNLKTLNLSGESNNRKSTTKQLSWIGLKNFLYTIEREVLSAEKNPNTILTNYIDIIPPKYSINSQTNINQNAMRLKVIQKTTNEQIEQEFSHRIKSHQILLQKTFSSRYGSLSLPPLPRSFLNMNLKRINGSKLNSSSNELIRKDINESKTKTKSKYQLLALRSYIIASKLALIGNVKSVLQIIDYLYEMFELKESQKILLTRILLLAHICSNNEIDKLEGWMIFVQCFGTPNLKSRELFKHIHIDEKLIQSKFNKGPRVNWFYRMGLKERIPITGRVIDALLLLNLETMQKHIKFHEILQWCAKFKVSPSFYIVHYISNIDQMINKYQIPTIFAVIVIIIVYIFFKYELFLPNVSSVDLNAFKVEQYAKKISENK